MLQVRKLHLENFRGFESINIDFGKHITCIAGVNGAGKTSCLDAIAYNLSWITEMLKLPPYQNGRYVSPSEKKKDSPFPAKISSDIEINGFVKNIVVGADSAPGMTIKFADEKTMKDLFEKINETYPIENRKNLPVIMYYPANRSDLDIDVSIDSEKDLSDKYEIYKNNLELSVSYKDFFRWFRDREDRENEEMVERYKNRSDNQAYEDKALKAVRNSISVLLPNFSQMTVNRKKQTILIKKDDIELDFSMLSDGEKEIITVFGDIARRLALANDDLENPLEGDGIILIDEIDLHLHPSWQRKICHALVETFPNCQFIITTHSPQILGELKPQDIRILNDFEISVPSQSYGLDSNEILETLQNTTSEPLKQNVEVSKRIDEIADLIDESKFKEAREKLQELEKELNGSISETTSLWTEIALMENAS